MRKHTNTVKWKFCTIIKNKIHNLGEFVEVVQWKHTYFRRIIAAIAGSVGHDQWRGKNFRHAQASQRGHADVTHDWHSGTKSLVLVTVSVSKFQGPAGTQVKSTKRMTDEKYLENHISVKKTTDLINDKDRTIK